MQEYYFTSFQEQPIISIQKLWGMFCDADGKHKSADHHQRTPEKVIGRHLRCS